jgi:hypothetical protein
MAWTIFAHVLTIMCIVTLTLDQSHDTSLGPV